MDVAVADEVPPSGSSSSSSSSPGAAAPVVVGGGDVVELVSLLEPTQEPHPKQQQDQRAVHRDHP